MNKINVTFSDLTTFGEPHSWLKALGGKKDEMIKLPSLFEEEAFKACEISYSLDWNRNSFTYSPCKNINLKVLHYFVFHYYISPFFVENIADVLNNFRSFRIAMIDDSMGVCS